MNQVLKINSLDKLECLKEYIDSLEEYDEKYDNLEQKSAQEKKELTQKIEDLSRLIGQQFRLLRGVIQHAEEMKSRYENLEKDPDQPTRAQTRETNESIKEKRLIEYFEANASDPEDRFPAKKPKILHNELQSTKRSLVHTLNRQQWCGGQLWPNEKHYGVDRRSFSHAPEYQPREFSQTASQASKALLWCYYSHGVDFARPSA